MDPRPSNALGTYFLCTGVGVLYKMKKLNKKVNLKIHLFIHLLYFVQNPTPVHKKSLPRVLFGRGSMSKLGAL